MWKNPILGTIAKGMQFAGLVDTTIHTPIGNIIAPRGMDVTNRNDRIGIANNAFDYMYRNLFTGNNASNWAKVTGTLSSRMDSRNLSQRPKILGFQI